MFTILIADDEAIIRRGIIAMLSRETIEDVTFVEASNGLEALEICTENKPDLVISDIRMPGVDGLEFIKKLQSSDHHPDVIILSGYEDFSYAKTAISLGVKEYILKPVKKQAFVSLISKYIREITLRNVQAEEEEKERASVKNVSAALKHNMLLELITSVDSAKIDSVVARLSTLGVALDYSVYLCAILQFQIPDDANTIYTGIAVQSIANEVHFQLGLHSAEVIDAENNFYYLLYGDRDKDKLLSDVKQSLSWIRKLIKKNIDLPLFTSVGSVVFKPAYLSQSGKEAKIALISRLFVDSSSAHFFSYLDLQEGNVEKLPEVDDKAVLSGTFIDTANAYFDRIIKQPVSINRIKLLIDSLLLLEKYTYKYFVSRGCELSYVPMRPIELICTDTQFHKELAHYMKMVKSSVADSGVSEHNTLLAEMIKYIQVNASSDINLNSVAEHFSRTPSYVSSLFTKLKGQSFTEMLTMQRINIAKELLADTNFNITEISQRSGYGNPKYLSSVFKKITGMTPNAYRKHCWLEK
ncbi:MAG: response regulator [Clostridiales Family XIII bacterium]|jgi:two-component system response regulator YesN|nr:response regulator [Clostridiales Family XIII bacterium]